MTNRLKYDPNEFDTRMTDWNLKHNVITKKQLEDYRKQLTDDGEKCELIQIDDGTEVLN